MDAQLKRRIFTLPAAQILTIGGTLLRAIKRANLRRRYWGERLAGEAQRLGADIDQRLREYAEHDEQRGIGAEQYERRAA